MEDKRTVRKPIIEDNTIDVLKERIIKLEERLLCKEQAISIMIYLCKVAFEEANKK